MTELPVPPTAKSDPSAKELARVWVVGDQQHVTLNIAAWSDPALWGLLLVDLARHLARAYEGSQGLSAPDVLARIREGFDAEWETPTDTPSGGML